MMDDLQQEGASKFDTSNPFTSVPIEISVCVGKARPLVRELVNLEEDAILRLDKSVDDPVELYVGDKLIALGKLEEQEDSEDGQLYVRITEIVDLQTRS
jgi:flagellar motor switch protein FliN/FliY